MPLFASMLAILADSSCQVEWGSVAQWVSAVGSLLILGWTVSHVFCRNVLTRPNLVIHDQPDLQRQEPPVCYPPAIWVRFRVTNKGKWRRAAKNCRAFLIGLYKEQSANTFEPMSLEGYNDIRQLTWTHGRREPTGMDILPGITQRFDLFATTTPPEGGAFLQLQTFPLLPDMTIVEPGNYLAVVQVSAEDAAPKTMEFLIEWNGKWDEVKAGRSKARYRIVER